VSSRPRIPPLGSCKVEENKEEGEKKGGGDEDKDVGATRVNRQPEPVFLPFFPSCVARHRGKDHHSPHVSTRKIPSTCAALSANGANLKGLIPTINTTNVRIQQIYRRDRQIYINSD